MKIISKNFINFSFSKEKKDNPEKRALVSKILQNVRSHGDKALSEYTKIYDNVDIDPKNFRVDQSLLDKASVSSDIAKALAVSKKNIESYQKSLLPSQEILTNKEPYSLGVKYTPIDRVGVYIPSGSAPLLSTVLMTVVPAKVAGVKDIVVVCPPSHNGDIDPSILYCC